MTPEQIEDSVGDYTQQTEDSAEQNPQCWYTVDSAG